MATAQQLHVCIFDRDRESGSQIAEILTAEGHAAERLDSVETVFEAAKEGRFQLVLLDVSAPDDEALQLLDRIRKADSDLCVIALTANPSTEGAVKVMKRQAFDYLQKPVKEDELREVVRSAIREKGLLVDLETRLNHVIGQRLRDRRSAEALTLKQLANRTGLSVSLISQIELGKSAASMSTLHKLATALQVKMTYFFETL